MTENGTLKRILTVTVLATVISLISFRAHGAPAELPEHPSYTKLGPLNAIVIENLKGAPYVVYLHGYGGIGEGAYKDLRVEMQSCAALKQVNWIFPDAPRGGWFAITAVDSSGVPNEAEWQATLKPTRAALTKMIASAKADPRNVIWAGFSQGAITAVDYVLHSTARSKGLIINSGIYFNSTDWKRGRENLTGIQFFMSHDPTDETLPLDEAQKLETLLLENGLTGKLETHSQGHAIPPGFTCKAISNLLSVANH